MTDNISKITKILLFVLFAVSILFTVKFYMGMSSIEGMEAKEFGKIEKIATDESGTLLSGIDSQTGEKADAVAWLGYFFKFMYVLGMLATVFALGFSIWNFIVKFIDSPLKGLMALIPIILVVAVIFISYSSASEMKLDMPQYDGTDNEPDILKWTGTGMIAMYIFFALAIVSIAFAEISKVFK